MNNENTQPSSEQVFCQEEPFCIQYAHQDILVASINDVLVSLESADLDRAEAIALRDWLNKVLA